LPSSSYPMGPFCSLPIALCYSVASSLWRNAFTLLETSSLNVAPEHPEPSPDSLRHPPSR
jgi:hypothetical protein